MKLCKVWHIQPYKSIYFKVVHTDKGENLEIMKELSTDSDYEWNNIRDFQNMDFVKFEIVLNETGELVYRYYLKEPK